MDTPYEFDIYIMEDPEDMQEEMKEFIKELLDRLNCDPRSENPLFNVYLPRLHDHGGSTKFDCFHNAIEKSHKFLCILSPLNSNLTTYFQKDGLYYFIEEGKRCQFIPIFVGYSSQEDALAARPRELRCQTPIIFSRAWKDDNESWDKLKNSVGSPPIQILANDQYPVQCTQGPDSGPYENALMSVVFSSTLAVDGSDVSYEHPTNGVGEGDALGSQARTSDDVQSQNIAGPLSVSQPVDMFLDPENEVSNEGVGEPQLTMTGTVDFQDMEQNTTLETVPGMAEGLSTDARPLNVHPKDRSEVPQTSADYPPGIQHNTEPKTVEEGLSTDARPLNDHLEGRSEVPQSSADYPPGIQHNTQPKTDEGASVISAVSQTDSGLDNDAWTADNAGTSTNSVSTGQEKESGACGEENSEPEGQNRQPNSDAAPPDNHGPEVCQNGIAQDVLLKDISNRGNDRENQGIVSKLFNGLWDIIQHY